MPKQTPEWLTVKQAAEQLQVNIKTIRLWADDGKLVRKKITARCHRISAASVERLMS